MHSTLRHAHTHTLIRTHSDSDAHSHLLYYECLAHTRRILDTWIVLTIRIAVCNLLTFSTAEWQLRRGWERCVWGAWHFPLALGVPILRHSRRLAGAPWQRIHQSMWWELEELWQLFCAPLPLPSLLPPLPLCFICFTIFFNYFNATNMSAYFRAQRNFYPVSFFLWLLLLPVYDTHTHTHTQTCEANCVTGASQRSGGCGYKAAGDVADLPQEINQTLPQQKQLKQSKAGITKCARDAHQFVLV